MDLETLFEQFWYEIAAYATEVIMRYDSWQEYAGLYLTSKAVRRGFDKVYWHVVRKNTRESTARDFILNDNYLRRCRCALVAAYTASCEGMYDDPNHIYGMHPGLFESFADTLAAEYFRALRIARKRREQRWLQYAADRREFVTNCLGKRRRGRDSPPRRYKRARYE